MVITLIKDHVDPWRDTQARTLEAGLETICDRVGEDYDAQVAELRGAAHDLLNLTLAIAAQTSPLRPSPGFWYAFDRPVGFEPPLAGMARRLAPRRAHRARARVLAEIGGLVDRQIGRAEPISSTACKKASTPSSPSCARRR